MAAEVHLDPDLEALLNQQARDRNLDFDRVLNEAIRAGLSARTSLAPTRFALPTFHLGTDRVDMTKALALGDPIEDEETIRKLKIAEDQ